MKKLRTAIIGQGRSGRDIHGKYFRSEENTLFDIVAVVEFDPERRERALKEYPGCQVYENYTELFDRDDIDLVVNASYSEMHYPITRDLLVHGMNVVVEKPFARSRFECDELITLAKKNAAILAVFQQSFLAPFYTYAKELISSGKLGEIQQIEVKYNGFSRRWDWQTLQCKNAGGIYNTGPHPIGLALGFLDFDDNAKIEYSKLGCVNVAGDSDDYAKIILSAPGKPVIDVEVNSCDMFKPTTLKICGSKGGYITNISTYTTKYIIPEENTKRPLIVESLKKEDGTPAYCVDDLIIHEDSGDFIGTSFDYACRRFYEMLYANVTTGAPMDVTPEMAAKVISVIEEVHARNPLPLKYIF